jgi:hypothetical protein
MKKAIGITVHYDDQTTSKHAIADVILGLTSKGGGQSKYTYLNADDCPLHGAWKLVPAGSNQERGTSWDAFWACEERGCTNKPSKDWVETHPPDRGGSTPPPPTEAPSSDEFDDLPF